jgi:uncharacterized membrane protein
MNADLIRLFFTYAIALVTLIGTFVLIYTKLGEISAESLLALVTFVLGLALGFVFNRESTTAGARSAERAISQGANAGVIPPPQPPQPPQP